MTTAVAKSEPTPGEKFTNMVIREYSATISDGIELSPFQRKLAQHLFAKVDMTLMDLEAKRLKNNGQGQPITWANVNMNKLALDTVHRIELGLDALIPNHIHPIPYYNSKLQKYDLDLRIGYVGKDYYRQEVAIVKPLRVIYELVHATDKFTPIMKSRTNDVESYEFEITKPFERGAVIGGFGYIIYAEPSRNQLILITPKNFTRSKGAAKTKDFWEKDEEAMQLKTVVHRTTDKIPVDPKKTTAGYFAVEADDSEAIFNAEMAENANQTALQIEAEGRQIDAETGEILEEPKQSVPEGPGW